MPGFTTGDLGACCCPGEGGGGFDCNPCDLPAHDLTVTAVLVDAGVSAEYTLTYYPGPPPRWVTGCITDGIGSADSPVKIALACTGPADNALKVYHYNPAVGIDAPCPPGAGVVPAWFIDNCFFVSATCDPLDMVFTHSGTDSDSYTVTP